MNIVAAAVFSVRYFSMLLKNFVAAYQSLREACAISEPCTSTRTWSVFHCSPYLSQLTRCLDCASLFIYVHEHDRLCFPMSTEETAVFDCIC